MSTNSAQLQNYTRPVPEGYSPTENRTKLNMSMNMQTTATTWDTHGGYVPGQLNTTKLLEVVAGYEDSYNEIIDNKNIFTLHSYNQVYVQSGPLRECITAHLVNDAKSQLEVDKNKFLKTFLLLNKLKQIVDQKNNKTLTRAYVTCLSPGKQIYAHADTHGSYWNTINRYQFYYTGNDKMIQLIGDTLYPIKPGYLYHFDHQQIHSYHNNSLEDLLLIVFDISKKK